MEIFSNILTSFTMSSTQPCLLSSGQFSGEFGICCQSEYPRKCPSVAVPPPPQQCLPRPLGQPEDDQCSRPGERDNCPGETTLCCFNGCLNICLEGRNIKYITSVMIKLMINLSFRFSLLNTKIILHQRKSFHCQPRG